MAAGVSSTQVLIAVIGVVGTISVALIANWDKLGSRSPTPAPAAYPDAGPVMEASLPPAAGPSPLDSAPAPTESNAPGLSDGWVEQTLQRIATEQNKAAGTELDTGLRLEGVRAAGNEILYGLRVDADAGPADRAEMAPVLRALEAQVCAETQNFNLISRGAVVRYEVVDRAGVSIASLKITSCA